MAQDHVIELADGRRISISDEAWVVYKSAGKLVGRCLDLTEATFAPGEQTITALQLTKYKQLLQNNIYAYRNEILRTFFNVKPEESEQSERGS